MDGVIGALVLLSPLLMVGLGLTMRFLSARWFLMDMGVLLMLGFGWLAWAAPRDLQSAAELRGLLGFYFVVVPVLVILAVGGEIVYRWRMRRLEG